MLLRDLGFEIQLKLKYKLNRENAWKYIADYYGIREIFGLDESSPNAGETFLLELCDRNFTVSELCEALEKYDLLDILALFQEPVPLQVEPFPLVLSQARASHYGLCNEFHVQEGEELKLLVKAKGIPPPSYEWYLDNTVIPFSSSNLLVIPKFTRENEGQYLCKITQENLSETTNDLNIMLEQKIDKHRSEISAKKALLIANQNYDLDTLSAPANDTVKLCKVLKELYDFEVTIEEDLTGAEMKALVKSFWKCVPDNAYVLFYFAGHGFHKSSSLYFMGIDKVEAKDFGFEHAMSDEEVVQLGSEHSPSLLLMLCDTCQSELQEDKYVTINSQMAPKYNYRPYPDVIQAYATSKSGEAHEYANTGLFTKHLIQVLNSQTNLRVSDVLAKVREGKTKNWGAFLNPKFYLI